MIQRPKSLSSPRVMLSKPTTTITVSRPGMVIPVGSNSMTTSSRQLTTTKPGIHIKQEGGINLPDYAILLPSHLFLFQISPISIIILFCHCFFSVDCIAMKIISSNSGKLLPKPSAAAATAAGSPIVVVTSASSPTSIAVQRNTVTANPRASGNTRKCVNE